MLIIFQKTRYCEYKNIFAWSQKPEHVFQSNEIAPSMTSSPNIQQWIAQAVSKNVQLNLVQRDDRGYLFFSSK